MHSRRWSQLALLLLALALSAATLPERLAPEGAFRQYAAFLAGGEVSDVRGVTSVDGPPGATVAGFVGGAYRHGDADHGLVVAMLNCPDGLCFGASRTLASLQPRSAPVLHPLVDLAGASGPLLRAPAEPVAMGVAVLPVVSEHRRDDGRETRLTLLSVTDPQVRVLEEAISIHLDTGRRFVGTELRLVEGEGGTLDLLLDWKIWPGGDDHDAACIHSTVTRRFRLVDGRYREQHGDVSRCH